MLLHSVQCDTLPAARLQPRRVAAAPAVPSSSCTESLQLDQAMQVCQACLRVGDGAGCLAQVSLHLPGLGAYEGGR